MLYRALRSSLVRPSGVQSQLSLPSQVRNSFATSKGPIKRSALVDYVEENSVQDFSKVNPVLRSLLLKSELFKADGIQVPPVDPFVNRHIGPRDSDIQVMLETLGVHSLEELTEKVVPQSIRTKEFNFENFKEKGEAEVIEDFRLIMDKNKILKNFLGQGYYGSILPAVIRRNVLENAAFYTPYTPYQGEISQGRMELLFNFQTMVSDLTGLPFANASLLDESTACAEAMTLAVSSTGRHTFFVAQDCHPQNIELVHTRAEPFGVRIIVGDPATFDPASEKDLAGVLLQYPTTDGRIVDYSDFTRRVHGAGGLVVCSADILSLTILRPPGEFGADIAVGTTQRFGIPLGYGGPHAGYLAVADMKVVRKMPGRIIGLSVDSQGRPAYRLSLQAREQHIRREKATSNICTSQALLANMSGLYAMWHGPEGLRAIAERVHRFAALLATNLHAIGYNVDTELYFDTIRVGVQQASQFVYFAQQCGVNFRLLDEFSVALSVDETTTAEDVSYVLSIFAAYAAEAKRLKVPPQLPASIDLVQSPVLNPSAANEKFLRKSTYLQNPIFNSYHSETDLMRYLYKIVKKDLGLHSSMIPLGSCTMKLNAAIEMEPITWPKVANLHPFVPLSQARGYQQMLESLEKRLLEVTGLDKISFQPNAGSQGEYAGLLVIRKYLLFQGQEKRDICLVPISAHGTNPASAVMAGFKVVLVECDEHGYLSLDDLQKKLQKYATEVACIMITYPSTFGVFEPRIREATNLVHRYGGQVYIDGANLNAQIGLCKINEIGGDVCHMNLHKTFCIPHGGGGPGMGPIAVASHLAPFLPNHVTVPCGGDQSVGQVSGAPFSSASILPISWMYLHLMGHRGLTKATQVAILNANYLRKRLEPYFHCRFQGDDGFVAHEFVIDLKPFKKSAEIEVEDVAKRLMDYNYHSPTMSWPLPGTLMIEPTESEPKSELDRFCEAMISIRKEIEEIEQGKADKKVNVLKMAPHTQRVVLSDKWDRPYPREKAVFPLPWVAENKYWPTVGRIDNVYGDRNLVCTCPSPQDYAEKQ